MKRCVMTIIAVALCWTASAQSVFRLHYWFDDQYANGTTTTSVDGRWLTPVEASQLTDGIHTFSFQVQDSSGVWFSPRSYLFYRLPDTVTEQQVRYACWFDNDYSHTQSGNISAGNLLLETDMLATGIHTVHFQFNFSNSVTFKSFLFYKTPIAIDSDSMAYTFWFDQDYEHRHEGRFASEHLVFDIDSMPSGIHTLNAMFGDGGGATLKSFLFYKKPHDEIKIVQYEWWINDQDSSRHSIAVAPQDTVVLAALLSVPSVPIRSSCFHFNPNGGTPIVNAKNDIHFKFYNAEGRYAQKNIPYVDITVTDTIQADTLERNLTKTVVAPIGNDIYWFKLGVGIGDSLAFHTDKPCALQLFSPSGEEVFSGNGNSVLSWQGCHAWENGDYYLAVHDVADTGTVSVSYQWIYRYAVLAWDVHCVGNGGLSTITFEGNGFNSLDTIYLFKGADTLPALYIGRESNTTTAAIFNFENADTGMYRAVFMYEDENLYKSDVVYVETAMPIVLSTTCTYPETFLRGSTVTYTYTITNTGNMTAYAVPLYFYIATANVDDITYIKVEGLQLESIYDYLARTDYLSDNDLKVLKQISDSTGDDHYFIRSRNVADNGADSITVRSSFFSMDIAPYETKTIAVNMTAVENVEAWLSAPENWNAYTVDTIHSYFSPDEILANELASKSFCCWHTAFESMFSGLAIAATTQAIVLLCCGPEALPVAGMAAIAGCVSSMVSTASSTIASFVCSQNVQNPQLGQKSLSIVGLVLSCLYPIANALSIPVNIASLGLSANDIHNNSNVQKNPGCSTENHKGGESVPQAPVDPNEITGYTAESGSRYIGAEQMAMPYMIEFENDTAFATAHAHTVVVRDTLDGGVFDLNSFSATAFSIGERMEPINGVQSFVRTMDMRPSINVLAQVELDYRIDTAFGVATWTFSSLDPITMQPTTDPTLGFLPANFNGDGIGEVNFTINRRIPLADSSVIANRAYITFDNEDPIATSTWVNIVDNTYPVSTIDSISVENGVVSVSVRASDVLSGIWRYNVYGKIGGMWMPMAMNVSADSVAVFDADTSRFSGFQSTAIDSAGNVEPLGGLHQAIIVYDTVVVTACDSYMWFDSVYNASGDYSRRISATTAGGNDTLKTLLLTINHSGAGDTIAVACDNFIWHGVSISTTGTSTYQTTNAVGCDSTVTLHLTINHSMYTSEVVTACDSWQDYSSDTMLVTTATAANGCDSTHTIALTVNHSVATAEVVTACDEWQGYTGDTVLVTTATAANGCDSTHTISLIINNTVETQITDTAEGSYTWHDNEYTESGTYVWQGTTADGCDSTVTLMLVIEQDVGIEVIGSQAQVSVYPNPTDGWLTIGSDMVVAVEVFDHAGRRVAVFNDTNRIYLGDLPSGGYLLNIHLDHRVVTQRVQLNR